MSSSFGALTQDWLSPAELLTALEIRPGMTICEVGAGKAVYTFPLGHHVGSDGRVYALEWRPWAVDGLKDHLKYRAGPGNVDLVEGSPENTRLADASCDVVIFPAWNEVENPEAAVDEARRILREGGRMAIQLADAASIHTALSTIEKKSWSLLKTGVPGRECCLFVFEVSDESVQS